MESVIVEGRIELAYTDEQMTAFDKVFSDMYRYTFLLPLGFLDLRSEEIKFEQKEKLYSFIFSEYKRLEKLYPEEKKLRGGWYYEESVLAGLAHNSTNGMANEVIMVKRGKSDILHSGRTVIDKTLEKMQELSVLVNPRGDLTPITKRKFIERKREEQVIGEKNQNLINLLSEIKIFLHPIRCMVSSLWEDLWHDGLKEVTRKVNCEYIQENLGEITRMVEKLHCIHKEVELLLKKEDEDIRKIDSELAYVNSLTLD